MARLMDPNRTGEGMGLLYGRPGEGKTTAVTHVVITYNCVYLRASVAWTPSTMLKTLCRELGLEARRSRFDMLEACAQELALSLRPLIVDEADYIARPGPHRTDMLDALRDLYDLAQVPVMLVGMKDLVNKVKPSTRSNLKYADSDEARFHRRITEVVEFDGLKLVDAQMVAGELCEIGIEGALVPGAAKGSVVAKGTLIEHLFAECGGSIDRLVHELTRVERFGKKNDLDSVDLATWTSL